MLAPTLRVRDYKRTTLMPRHKRVVVRLAEGYFADDGPMDPARLDAFAEELDRDMSNASKTLRFGLKLMLDALRLLPLFVIGRLALFDELSLADRQRMLSRMESSNLIPVALIFVAYKTAMAILFFEDPAELRAIGYPGPARERYKRALPTAPSGEDARP
jgi:hypothetical protein